MFLKFACFKRSKRKEKRALFAARTKAKNAVLGETHIPQVQRHAGKCRQILLSAAMLQMSLTNDVFSTSVRTPFFTFVLL